MNIASRHTRDPRRRRQRRATRRRTARQPRWHRFCSWHLGRNDPAVDSNGFEADAQPNVREGAHRGSAL